MIRTWSVSWPWPQTLKKEEGEEKEGRKEEDSSLPNSSAPGKELNKEEEIKGRVELLSHNVELDRAFNRG